MGGLGVQPKHQPVITLLYAKPFYRMVATVIHVSDYIKQSPNHLPFYFSLQTLIKTFEVANDVPVRAASFITRKNWIVTGSVS